MRLVAIGLSLAICSGLAACSPPGSSGRSTHRVQSRSLVRGSLAHGLERRLTVNTNGDGTRVFPAHCQNAPGGCEARIHVIAQILETSAAERDLDPFLLGAMAFRESGLNPAAVGRQGEAGILQLHPRGGGHAIRFVQDSRYRERCLQSTEACQGEIAAQAARIIAESLRRCGSLEAALGRYASGRCNDDLEYIDRVLAERDRLVDLAAE